MPKPVLDGSGKRRTSARAFIHAGLSALWSYHLSGSDTGATSLHQVFKLRALSGKQELRRRTVQVRLIKLADGRAQFEELPALGCTHQLGSKMVAVFKRDALCDLNLS